MRGDSWAAIAEDPNIWKKIAQGALSFSFIFTTPLGLGMVNTDLEAEEERRRNQVGTPNLTFLSSTNDWGKILGSGVGPSFAYLSILAIYAMVSIPVGLSYFQVTNYFRPPNPLMPELHVDAKVSFTSLLIFILIGLAGMIIQAIVSATLPVALAQYARGQNIQAALSPLGNALTVLNMGSSYWIKASGVALGLFLYVAYMLTSGFNLGAIPSTLLWFFINAGLFVSLILSSRMALDYLVGNVENES